eukprot:1159991-Pelagomonas_calceolata.AAC.3
MAALIAQDMLHLSTAVPPAGTSWGVCAAMMRGQRACLGVLAEARCPAVLHLLVLAVLMLLVLALRAPAWPGSQAVHQLWERMIVLQLQLQLMLLQRGWQDLRVQACSHGPHCCPVPAQLLAGRKADAEAAAATSVLALA